MISLVTKYTVFVREKYGKLIEMYDIIPNHIFWHTIIMAM